MADINSGPGWSEAQWEKVNGAITEAFEKASVAGAFIPCYGPLPGSAEYVKKEELKVEDGGVKVKVTDDETLKLFNLTVKVELSSEQVAEESLSSAILVFRRAANTLAQVEDYLVFNGYDPEAFTTDTVKAANAAQRAAQTKVAAAATASAKGDPRLAEDLRAAEQRLVDAQVELADATRAATRTVVITAIAVAHPEKSLDGLAASRGSKVGKVLDANAADRGQALVSAIVQAIGKLEDNSYPGPFACVLGTDLFDEAYRPVAHSMVLPADRITPLLNGPLLRSGQMHPAVGIVASLSSSAIDIVVATPPRAHFLQLTLDAKYSFRVYEKFTLRIKDANAVEVF